MILILNLVLELSALAATWTRKLYWLRAFLVYELLFDTVGVFVPHRGFVPWYYYWIGRSIDLVLMLMATHYKDEKGIITVWRAASLSVFGCMLARVWFGRLTNDHMSDLMSVGLLLLAMILFLILVFTPRNWCLWAGFVAWVVALFLPLQWYPGASLAPLAIWSSAFLWRRGLWHHAKGERIDDTNNGGDSIGWRESSHPRNRVKVLSETMR